ncbi:dihydroxyacetone kinase subunit DhaL [Streptomyces sp. KLOTTS4A1]|uniref:dihydroxyacetone kinase subunit DhaL n=1 Tax=Streptomyces sp. KLOTTS4A1 TaxID=3390996 RepID=UPI0039F61618
MLDAEFFRRWMTTTAAAVDREAARLTDLDSPIGDADHGTNLRRGFTAVASVLGSETPETPGAVLVLAGRQLISTVGGASGPLYGTLLRRTGKELGEAAEVSAGQFADALRAGVEAVEKLGGAAPGDKTMVDALDPAVAELAASSGSGAELPAACAAAAEAGARGAEATIPLIARKGRASYLGERSIGHQDPGATSSALLFAALAETAAGGEGGAR